MDRNQLAPLPEYYDKVIAKIAEQFAGMLFGIRVTDGPLLRDLARLAEGFCAMSANPYDALQRIKALVLTTLASTYTWNNKGLETGQEFPNSLGPIDYERWYVGIRYTQFSEHYGHPTSLEALEGFYPGRYTAETLRDLEVQLGARIGDCAMYAVTLGILLASCGLWKEVFLHGKPPHAWVWAWTGDAAIPGRRLDLAGESHGLLEDEYQASLEEDEKAENAIKYDLSVK